MRILVTGGGGFIGSNLAKRLAADGYDPVVADDFSSASWKNLVDFTGDVFPLDLAGDLAHLKAAGPFEVVFHEASITDTTVVDQRHMLVNNVQAFRNLLDLAVAWDARVIWASSCSIYGQGPAPMKETQAPQPLNVYAYSKLAMEHLAERYRHRLRHPIVGLRYSNVYGPGEDHKGKFASMIHQLAKQMRQGKQPRIFRAGEQRRDFVYVDDVVQANLQCLQASQSGVYNAGAGQAWSFNQVVAELNRVLGTNLAPEYFENPYSFTQDWTQTDLTQTQKALHYQPQYDLQRGIDAYHASGKLGLGT